MRYLKFTIRNYRAIDGPLEIDLSKQPLIPIIGINECGKTTILHAVFAFDYHNDNLNNGRHIQDVANLYSLDPKPAKLSATIEITQEELRSVVKKLEKAQAPADAKLYRPYLRKSGEFAGHLIITRDFKSKDYTIDEPTFPNSVVNQAVAKEVIRRLPYILFFDDFRDSVSERVEIVKTESASPWLPIFETLFRKTDPSFSVFDLPKKEVRQRKTILSKVNRNLNRTLTREWQNFRLDDADALTIAIEYDEETEAPSTIHSYLKLDVIEKDVSGDDHYFFVQDRSKGFYWFFNFVMKLEFNPKVAGNADVDAIYLLDEPGSYLHAAAQAKLATKLRNLSQRNKVIYCTHSHHLLDPEVIPISTIRIAEKDGHGRVHLVSIHEHTGTITERRSAYQPLIDALQIRPLALDFGHQPVLLVEGMVDFYLFDMFKGKRDLTIIPSVGSSSMKFYISILIAWRLKFCALWDNDDAGRRGFEEATEYFGEQEARSHFRLLPPRSPRSKDTILQHLVEGTDLVQARTRLGLPTNTSFAKSVAAWYYSRERDKLAKSASTKSRASFEQLLSSLPLGQMDSGPITAWSPERTSKNL